ncbi:DUF3352 domain-containing protein [Candidatus Peregrinibacteria bacterium]|nr:DUF3352 domain-containing protein [Candidatus Peregrinibacteria bacterium]
MKKPTPMKQKQVGLIMVIFGIFCLIGPGVYFVFQSARITGIPELLPADETVAFIESTGRLPSEIELKINETFGLFWERDIAPWASGKAALAFLSQTNGQESKLVPYVFVETNSPEKAFEFLKNYKNQGAAIKEKADCGTAAFDTPAISFAFWGKAVAIAPSSGGLQTLCDKQSALTKHLSNDIDFIRVRQNLTKPFWVYLKPKQLPRESLALIAKYFPRLPWINFSFKTLGMAIEKNENVWSGSSYAINDENIPLIAEQSYRALLLPLLPPDSELVLSGQNLPSQINKIDSLIGKDKTAPRLATLLNLFADKYLPGINFEKDLAPIMSSESALSINGAKILFITQLPDNTYLKMVENVRSVFAKTAATFSPKEREVILPDGTKAAELIPNPEGVRKFSEDFNGVQINGFIFGQKGNSGEIYDSLVADKWIVSNDLPTLKKAIQLTKEPGINFMESARYKDYLNPIMKNPELLGMAVLPNGVFTFSKRTHSDHMETSFIFVIE